LGHGVQPSFRNLAWASNLRILKALYSAFICGPAASDARTQVSLALSCDWKGWNHSSLKTGGWQQNLIQFDGQCDCPVIPKVWITSLTGQLRVVPRLGKSRSCGR
jgi:hypothetical protein